MRQSRYKFVKHLKELAQKPLHCLVCKSRGKIQTRLKSKKSVVTCPICKGSKINPLFYDKGGVPIIPGFYAKINTNIESKDGLISYTGIVRATYFTSRGNPAVDVIAIPWTGRSYNHGMRSASPENIQMVRKPMKYLRKELYKEKLTLKRESNEKSNNI